jgi:hypothetical protein
MSRFESAVVIIITRAGSIVGAVWIDDGGGRGRLGAIAVEIASKGGAFVSHASHIDGSNAVGTHAGWHWCLTCGSLVVHFALLLLGRL